ncbi:peroxiredoxin family protein [Halobacillus seohaensis]|uniref:Peroxiredoxin family protein n=1 Tax=Halobacillus seohaensis TaxID=447421 RepID=A0ABW2ESA8_9BACI
MEKMPNFNLKDTDGNEVSIEDYKGKQTLIFMWASW